MKDATRKTVKIFLDNADAISDDVMEDTKEMLGTMPFIFPLQRERPENFALSALADYRTCRPEHLPPKIAELIAVAAAAGAGADNCLKVHINAARKEGATRDEIFDTIMIAGVIGKTKVLASSLRMMTDVFPQDTKK